MANVGQKGRDEAEEERGKKANSLWLRNWGSFRGNGEEKDRGGNNGFGCSLVLR